MEGGDFELDTEEEESSEEIQEFVNSIEQEFRHHNQDYDARDLSEFIKSMFGKYKPRLACWFFFDGKKNKK